MSGERREKARSYIARTDSNDRTIMENACQGAYGQLGMRVGPRVKSDDEAGLSSHIYIRAFNMVISGGF